MTGSVARRTPWRRRLDGLYPGELDVRGGESGSIRTTRSGRTQLMNLGGGPVYVAASGEPAGDRVCVLDL